MEENRVEAVAQHRYNNNQDFLSTICGFAISFLGLKQMFRYIIFFLKLFANAQCSSGIFQVL